MLQSNECNVSLNLTLVGEANKNPPFAEEPDEALIQRIVDVLFGSTFVEKADEVDVSQRKYPANPRMKDINSRKPTEMH